MAVDLATFSPKRILVCQLRQIGDVVLATPSIELLKRRYPDVYKRQGTVTGAGTAFGGYNAFSCFFHSYFINDSPKHVTANRANGSRCV